MVRQPLLFDDGIEMGNLNNRIVFVQGCLADDPRETRERYTKK